MITAAELAVKVTADTSQAESGLKSFSGKMNGMAGQMGAVGGILSATIAAPLIGIGVTAVKTAADFERSMNVLGYATEASASQMQTLSDQALQLGADTVFSANEAAEGMVDLAKAGMTTEEIMGSIGGVMDLAAAGAIGVSEAANLTAAALNTFNLDASESGRVADVLAAAANASTAEVSDLAFGLQNAGSVFASNGQSVESLATMMALLANNGLSAGNAATALKTMTLRLTAPTAQAAKVMKNLGLRVFDAQGNMRDYRDIIADLSSTTAGFSDVQKDAAFQTIFGLDAINAANILAKEGVASYDAMATAVSEQGAAAAMANAQNSGLAGAMEQIGGSLESLMTKLALPFLDTLATWTTDLAGFVNSIGMLPQPVINAALAFAGFAVAASLALLAAAGIAAIIGTLATPIGLAALALVLLGLAAAGLWAAWETNFGNIQEKTQAVLDVVNPLIETLSTTLSGMSTSISSAATDIAVLLALNPQWQTFIANVEGAAAAALTLATNIGTAITNFKLPTLEDLTTLKSDIAIQFKATVETLLDPPKLTIAPFPPMTIPAPEVTIAPAAGVAGQLAGAAAKGAAVGGATGAANMLDSMTQAVEDADWEGAGHLTANLIILAWNSEMAKLGTLLKWTGVFGDVIAGWVAFNAGLFAALTGFSTDLATLDIAAKISAFGKALTDGIATWFKTSIGDLIGTAIKPAPDATSTSDVLRERALGSGFKFPDFSDLTRAIPGTVALIESFGTALSDPTSGLAGLGTASETATTLIDGMKAGFDSFKTTVSGFKWPASLAFDWHTWITPLDWGRFIGGLFGGGGAAPTTTPTGGGGGKGQKPTVDDGSNVGASFAVGGTAAVATAQFGGGWGNTGVVIRIDNVNVHNDMDIEELAAKLARRFQQKLR